MQAAGEPPLTEPAAGQPSGGQSAAPPSRSTRYALAGTALTVVVVDLISKTWVVQHYGDGHVTQVLPGLKVLESRNAGAAFGLATGATIVLSLVALVVAAVIVRESRRLRSMPWAIALGLLLGGAVGNLGDRIFRSPGFLRGQVVDWISVPHWPVFNLADSGITIGGILAVVLALRGLRLDGTRERP